MRRTCDATNNVLSLHKKTTSKFIIDKVNTDREREATRELVKRFWGEEEQLTFDKKFTVAELPTFIAKSNNNIFGFISFAETAGATIIVALGVLPKYQDVRIGKSLVKKVEDEVKKLQRKRLLVSASNDDLPALAFYQSLGFQIYEVKPNVIAEKHGKVLKGIGGLPIRDELRLQKTLS
ncbi:MAG: GNAT family N-acetyltransferase [Candidatus Bathyarchaeota archaeon]|nr:GNAT family N-acetyltransferase [Candidatus Bathyarchaeota archaeon]